MTAAPSDLARCPFDGAPLLLYLGERTVLEVCPRNCCREMRGVVPEPAAEPAG